MIGYLAGRVLEWRNNMVLLGVNGIGYEVYLAGKTQKKVGQAITLYIFTHLKADGRSESALELFGFETLWDKEIFLLMTSVSGVGYRTALTAIGALSADSLISAIVRQDRALLTSAPGIGKKTAERILVELSDKAQKLMTQRQLLNKRPQTYIADQQSSAEMNTSELSQSSNLKQDDHDQKPESSQDLELTLWTEAQMALQSLGYGDADINQTLRGVFSKTEAKNLSTEAVIKAALQKLHLFQKGANA